MINRIIRMLGISVMTFGLATTAQATLEWRLGGKAVYDTDTDITWLADPSAASANIYDNGTFNNDGLMTWSNAVDWLANLNVAGVTGWYATEESHRWYGNGCCITAVDYLIDKLLNAPSELSSYPQPVPVSAISEFSGAFSRLYWATGSLLVCGGQPCPDQDNSEPFAINFFPNSPYYRTTSSSYLIGGLSPPEAELAVLAMHNGDVFAQIPEPNTIMLISIGLAGLLGFGCRRLKMNLT
ncbi:MAG: PEP-CTERM sorting domain-containing protein [Nitrosomonas sp.]|nr:PEP-CTERM sorting domain-containing protein [Nitrosomonas sp.]